MIDVGAWDSDRPVNKDNSGESAACTILLPPKTGVTPYGAGREDPGGTVGQS